MTQRCWSGDRRFVRLKITDEVGHRGVAVAGDGDQVGEGGLHQDGFRVKSGRVAAVPLFDVAACVSARYVKIDLGFQYASRGSA